MGKTVKKVSFHFSFLYKHITVGKIHEKVNVVGKNLFKSYHSGQKYHLKPQRVKICILIDVAQLAKNETVWVISNTVIEILEVERESRQIGCFNWP